MSAYQKDIHTLEEAAFRMKSHIMVRYRRLNQMRNRERKICTIAQNEGANSKGQAEQTFYCGITNDDGGSILSERCRKLLHGGADDRHLVAGV